MLRLLGSETTDRVDQVWGIDDQRKMANMWKRTPQPGHWVIGGVLRQSRVYSKYVALQIKAIELGLISAAMPA